MKNYEIQTLNHNTLLKGNVSLINECRPNFDKNKISGKNNIVNLKIYNLSVNCP